MRTITLKVTINVADDYEVCEPEWLLEDAYLNNRNDEIVVESVSIIKED